MQEVKQFICAKQTPPTEANVEMNYPHHSAFVANIVQKITLNAQELKYRKDNPIQIKFGSVDGRFIISVSFLADFSSLRQMCKKVVSAVFQRAKADEAFRHLKLLAPEFVK